MRVIHSRTSENPDVVKDNMEREVDSYLRRNFEASIRDIEVVHKEDLALVC